MAVDTSWRVAVTRDEAVDGPLSLALTALGLRPVHCPVAVALPPEDPTALRLAAQSLASYRWVICSSQRAVDSLVRSLPGPWPAGPRTAAVGHRTAAALVAAGANPPPVVGPDAGANALWETLQPCDTWHGRRVLLLTVPGGRRDLSEALRDAGAQLDVIDAYRMARREPGAIRDDWTRRVPDAVVFGSPSAVEAIVGAVGVDGLRAMKAIVAIGATTAATAAAHGLAVTVAPQADFTTAAWCVDSLRRGR
jgi:uroporphyrinogen-III synthase